MAFVCAGLTLLASCGGAPTGPETPKTPPKEAPAPSVPEGSVDRQLLDSILRQGPPWMLERVPIEEVMEAGKFKGWRLQDFPVEWGSIDLQPGDVILSINDLPLERPDELFAAWTSMSASREIKLAYVREGEQRSLTIPIFGEPDPNAPALGSAPPGPPPTPPPVGTATAAAGSASASAAPPPEPPPTSKPGAPMDRKKTIVIKGEDRPSSELQGEW